MGLTQVLFDTNILIDFLKGIPAAKSTIEAYLDRSISQISWMEVMAGTTPENELTTRTFLREFTLHAITDEIAEKAVKLRRQNRFKLPDAIIFATAQVHKRLFITRNTRDFDAEDPQILSPYNV